MHQKLPSSIAELLPSRPEGQPGASALSGGDTLVDLFERMAAAQRNNTAVVCGLENLSYSELDARANRVARLLRGQTAGVEATNSFVAIYLSRSTEMVVGMLGILKAGYAYLPIDATYPVARVMEMLQDASPIALVTTAKLAQGLAEELRQMPIATLKLDESNENLELYYNENFARDVKADDLAYLMYTSGSTGKPKGVMVTHRNVVRLLKQTRSWFEFDRNDVWTLFHSMSFDFSVWEIWGCLLTGGRLVMVSHETSRSPREFHELLVSEQVTVLNQTPSAFQLLLSADEDSSVRLDTLRLIIFGGEALQYRALTPWFRRYGTGSTQLVNMYGITETTVHVTYRMVTAADAERTQESLIGVPIPDMQLYLLDEFGKPVANGVVGELYVGGAGVSAGYLNRPELNRERFIADPYSAEPGGRLYRTGDVGRIRADGEMVYLGRNDRQVKISGFRIELGEIEAAIAECPGVRQACVVARGDADGAQRIAAYFVTTAANPSAGTLSHFLAARLPAHMRPSFYMGLEKLPLTSNGKIDVASLPEPNAVGRSGHQGIAQPAQVSTDLERGIREIWYKALGTASAGLDDNFFDIGGTSLLLIRTHGLLELQLGRRIPITWMFEFPTVRSLAMQLATGSSRATSTNKFQSQARRQRGAFARAAMAKRVLP